MMQQEKSQWKGGLLGDEMGMGKTIQAVSLLMSDYPTGIPSLVVVPPVALMQWQSEINVSFSFVEEYPGSLRQLLTCFSFSNTPTASSRCSFTITLTTK